SLLLQTTAPTDIYPLSLHDALPIFKQAVAWCKLIGRERAGRRLTSSPLPHMGSAAQMGDRAPMRFSLFYNFDVTPEKDVAELYRDVEEQAILADRLGFDAIW